jgi:hypothetical protein
MNRNFLFFIALLFLWRCSGENARRDLPDSSKTHQEKNTSLIVSRQGLPLGSDLLLKLNLPVIIPDDSISPDDRKRAAQIDAYYASLHSKAKKKRHHFKVEPIRLTYATPFSDTLIYAIDSVAYQLPDVGPYRCYYLYSRSPNDYIRKIKQVNFEVRNSYWYDAACLLFVDKKSGVAKSLPVYVDVHEPFSGYSRYFHISESFEITLVDTYADELETTVEKSYKITIKNDGKFVFEPLANLLKLGDPESVR